MFCLKPAIHGSGIPRGLAWMQPSLDCAGQNPCPQCGLLNSVDDRYFGKALRPSRSRKKKKSYKNVNKIENWPQSLYQCGIFNAKKYQTPTFFLLLVWPKYHIRRNADIKPNLPQYLHQVVATCWTGKDCASLYSGWTRNLVGGLKASLEVTFRSGWH